MPLSFENKKEIIGLIKDQLESELIELKRLIDQADQESINAPGKMQSWSDTSKDEYANVRNSLQKVYSERQDLKKQMEQLQVKEADKIEVDSLFSIENGLSYLALPSGGLNKIRYKETDITVVGAKAPLFSTIQGLSKGEQFTWPNGKQSTIRYII